MAVVQNIAAYTFPQIAHLQQEFYLHSQFFRIYTNVDFFLREQGAGSRRDKGDKEVESKLI
ncbi:hypothetical protein [Scytonema millei]|uniref:Uncharacterized protein n=1 Tax=Scytonema millei VB511283 TaxID=1245923 RepID=A0A9X5E537_9CYAN|nr:hypothetical protein [Scytonema millei]NHC34167.1 hypothetical protein [Scytonema millei VB511283]